MNLAINSRSGEGKSYVIQKAVDNFPKQDLIVYSAMSDKALFHRAGILVIKNEQKRQIRFAHRCLTQSNRSSEELSPNEYR